MFKSFLILLLSVFLLFACSKKENKKIVSEPTEREIVLAIYAEAVDALKKGDAYYAGKKFKEAESLLPQSEWAAKASLMASYADYSRNAYSQSVFGLERHVANYPADKNVPYAHYLIAICYYEQILDEKKDLKPLLKAKEMSIARHYMKTEKWIAALNRLKIVVEEYDKTVFIEEALHRLVEVYYKIGLVEEAKKAAAILGYNYQSSRWYARSYKVFNKKYETKKIKEEKKKGLIRRKINALFE